MMYVRVKWMDKDLRFVGERRNPDGKREIPARVMRRPNSRMILQRSQPRPALSGQLTVTMQGSLWSFPCWITTTSSHGIPMTLKCGGFKGRWPPGRTLPERKMVAPDNGVGDWVRNKMKFEEGWIALKIA